MNHLKNTIRSKTKCKTIGETHSRSGYIYGRIFIKPNGKPCMKTDLPNKEICFFFKNGKNRKYKIKESNNNLITPDNDWTDTNPPRFSK